LLRLEKAVEKLTSVAEKEEVSFRSVVQARDSNMEWLSTLEGKIFNLNDAFKEELSKLMRAEHISDDDDVLLNTKLCLLMSYAIRGQSELDSTLACLNTISFIESDFPKIGQKASYILWMIGVQLEAGTNTWELLCSLVSRLATDKIISVSTLTSSLDMNLLTCAGLLGSTNADEKRLAQKLVKLNTNAMYRQQKYNLLEEEKEGFSKLIVLAATLPGYPADISDQQHQFLSIIGLMDLDPNRVLDILLDAFEKNTWNLSYISLLNKLNYNTRYISDIVGMKLNHYHPSYSKVEKHVEEVNGSADATNEIPAQETASEETADKSHEEHVPYSDLLLTEMKSPAELYGLVAVLISSEILTIYDVLPYLEPNLHSMINDYKHKNEERKESVRNVPPVIMGASLGDSEQVDKAEVTKITTPENMSLKPDWVSQEKLGGYLGLGNATVFAEGEQIIGVLSALLAIRCWDSAEVLINLLEAGGIDPFQIASARDALSDLIDWVITSVYEDNTSFKKYALMGKQSIAAKNIAFDSTKILSKPTSFEAIPRTLIQMEMLPSNANSLRDFPILMTKFLFRMKHHLACYPILFQKLCRIFQCHMSDIDRSIKSLPNEQDVTAQKLTMYQPTMSIVMKVFLPSLTCVTSSDPSYLLSRQVWEVMKFLPYQLRFDAYGIWLGKGIGKLGLNDSNKSIDCCHAEMVASQHIRALLKRITADNAKVIGKKLARYFPTSPLVVYDYFIKQVCAYENLIPIIIDSMKYASELGFDCMAYCLVRKLRESVANGSAAEPKMKEEDTNVTQWFANICKFTANFYMKYPMTELKALFDYVLQQCSQGNAVDLLLLKDLLNVMGGCDSIVEVSKQQLEGLSGGRTLRNEMTKGSTTDAASLTKSRTILREALFTSGSAFPILLTVAQIRKSLLHSKDIKNLKLLSHLHDTSHDFFMQYTDYLVGSDVSFLQKIEKSIPAISTLLGDFNLHISVVFQLIRPLVRSAMAFGIDPKSSPLWLQSWHPFNDNMKHAFELTLEYIACKDFISYELFIMFWSLSIYDLEVPKEKYEQEISRLTKTRNDLDKQLKSLKMLPLAAKTAREDVKKHDKLVKALQEEERQQMEHVAIIKAVMQELSTVFFSSVTPANQKSATHALLQHCVYPRMRLSPVDSVFSVRFFYSIHQLRVPGFSTILFADRMLATLPPLIFQSTEGEASCVGHAIDALLQILVSWFKSEADYNATAFGSPGFSIGGASTEFYSYIHYKSWCHGWHDRMVNVVTSCLESPEYIHIRSALVYLNKIADQFPIWQSGAFVIQKSIDHLEKTETERNDLRLMSRSLKSIMAKQASSWLDIYDKPPKVFKKVVHAGTIGDGTVQNKEKTESAEDKEVRRGIKRPLEDGESAESTTLTDPESQKQLEMDARNRILASKANSSSSTGNGSNQKVREERRNDNSRLSSNPGYRGNALSNVSGDIVRNERNNFGEKTVPAGGFQDSSSSTGNGSNQKVREERRNDNSRLSSNPGYRGNALSNVSGDIVRNERNNFRDKTVPAGGFQDSRSTRDNNNFREQDRRVAPREIREVREREKNRDQDRPPVVVARDSRDFRQQVSTDNRDDKPVSVIRENRDDRPQSGRDNRDGKVFTDRDNRDDRIINTRDDRDQRESRNMRDNREGWDNRDVREARDMRDTRDQRQQTNFSDHRDGFRNERERDIRGEQQSDFRRSDSFRVDTRFSQHSYHSDDPNHRQAFESQNRGSGARR